MTSITTSVYLRGALATLVFGAVAARAQKPAAGSSSCEGKSIDEIHVSALRPPFSGEAAYWRRVARSLGLHHRTTDTAVVRRFLALEAGGPCSDFRLRESARLLRQQPFLADARVRAVPDSLGGVNVDVETTDEIPAVASISLGNGRLSYIEVGNNNMFGDAWLLAVHASDRVVEGRSAGFRMSDYQFLARPYQLDAQLDWGERTSSWLLAASHAYLTDLQKIAWEAGIAHAGQEFLQLHRGDNQNDLALEYRRYAADVGGVVKLGNLRTPILVGGLLTFYRVDPGGAFAVGNNGFLPDTTLAGRYSSVRRMRPTGVAAWRNLNYVTAHGFEALTATQDVPTGFQIFGQLGRGMRSVGGTNDVFMLTDVLAGLGSAKTYSELHLISEGRHEDGATNWDGIVSSGRLGLYWQPNELHTFRAWTDYAGGWRVETPFQLQLSTEDQRLIGYKGSLFGGRRVGGGVELRRLLPHVTSRGDVGLGVFVHAARLWAGDVPFGVNTPVLPSAGISLLGALPKGSQRLLRIDLGAPLRPGLPRSGWEVRLTYFDEWRVVREEPRDIAFAREQIVGPNVFRP